MVRTIPINATVFKDGLRIVESYVTVGTRFVFKWELYAEYGKCFYDLEIPENYDEEGKLVATEPYGGSLRVTKQESLTVEDQPLEPGAIEFFGVLTDVYQRLLMTEVLEAYIE